MKIIDLLNKIANGEKVPKKVRYNDEIYDTENTNNFSLMIYETTGKMRKDDELQLFINEEVEIIEEKKIPEIIHWHEENGVGNDDDAFYVDVNDKSQYVDSEYDSWEMTVILKINEIIDYLASKEKGDK